jgi:hypothetical protein
MGGCGRFTKAVERHPRARHVRAGTCTIGTVTRCVTTAPQADSEDKMSSRTVRILKCHSGHATCMGASLTTTTTTNLHSQPFFGRFVLLLLGRVLLAVVWLPKSRSLEVAERTNTIKSVSDRLGICAGGGRTRWCVCGVCVRVGQRHITTFPPTHTTCHNGHQLATSHRHTLSTHTSTTFNTLALPCISTIMVDVAMTAEVLARAALTCVCRCMGVCRCWFGLVCCRHLPLLHTRHDEIF